MRTLKLHIATDTHRRLVLDLHYGYKSSKIYAKLDKVDFGDIPRRTPYDV